MQRPPVFDVTRLSENRLFRDQDDFARPSRIIEIDEIHQDGILKIEASRPVRVSRLIVLVVASFGQWTVETQGTPSQDRRCDIVVWKRIMQNCSISLIDLVARWPETGTHEPAT